MNTTAQIVFNTANYFKAGDLADSLCVSCNQESFNCFKYTFADNSTIIFDNQACSRILGDSLKLSDGKIVSFKNWLPSLQCEIKGLIA